MRAFLSRAIEAIPTEGEDRLITNEICMNDTCLSLEMDLRELMENTDQEEEVGEEEEVEEIIIIYLFHISSLIEKYMIFTVKKTQIQNDFLI